MKIHERPGKSFMEMLDLILRHMRRPNDPFSPQLLMSIFWEEGFFTNKKQLVGSAIGFGQAEPAELPKLTTQMARDNGYEVPGVSKATRTLSDALAVTVPSCMLLHLFHSSSAPTTEGKVTAALHGYGGVEFKGKSSLTRTQRLAKIAGWLRCEAKLKELPFSEYKIINYAGDIRGLEDRYMDALAQARGFRPDSQMDTSSPERVRDVLFPKNWALAGLDKLSPSSGAARPSAAPAASSRAAEDGLFETMLAERHVHLADQGPFHVVAGPGESLPELAAGDFLVRRADFGSRPRMAAIRSAPATAEDFFFEGVLAEHAPSGLFVEVASQGPRRVARRITDSSGRLAEHTMVIRPSAVYDDESDEDFAETSDSELRKKRDELVAAITKQDLNWHVIPLADGYKIRVSSPIMKEDLFIPVTQKEAIGLARQFKLFPLSRAVMDQTHNFVTRVEKPQSPGSLFDFVTYSRRLKDTAYYKEFGYSLASGAHKLWVVSSRAAAVNYGFYIKRVRGELVRCGPHLDKQLNVIQGLGARHNALHWDYSQLLQFMSGLEDPSGQRIDLRQALMDKLPAVWDELQPPHPGSLP